LWLQRGKSHFRAEQLLESLERANTETADSGGELSFDISTELPEELSLEEKNKRDITTILVVDDNSELRHFLSLRLSSYYKIIQASDGQKGLEMASLHLPDLIISDVMMPKMNGLEMVAQLRQFEATSTIPLILLTAKSTKRETVEGLQRGADDYLTKPFDTSELIVRVARLLTSRKALRESIITELSEHTPEIDDTRSFNHQVMSAIRTHYTDPELSIDKLASMLNMSRSSLYRRCQQEFSQSLGQMITEQRMAMSLQLLKRQKHSISEIAYASGFESLSYFSRTFKKHFGKSPTSFLK
jgi:YesN/AraC family two-component response regulator